MNYSVDTDLLIKYFSGLASPGEALRIDEWRREQPEHEQYFKELAAGWTTERNYQQPDMDTLWQQFTVKTSTKQAPVKQRAKVLRWLPYAALLVLVLGIALWQNGKNTEEKSRFFAYSATNDQFELKNGAIARLMPGALLKEAILAGDTLFTLKGSALFDFKQDFPGFRLVLPSGVYIKDLGTKFLVEGDADSAKITVYTGMVAAWYKTDTIMAGKNEVLTFNKASGFAKTDLTGTFDYNDYSLKQVCDSVGNYFHTDLQIGEHLLTDRMLTLKGKDLSLEQVLEIITETLDIKYEALAKDTIIFTSN
ncbi:MAG: hypothetical protein EOP54_04530 [Sphingobacteriales bacterium]|nr:MAG: hypothetical protein EOP54_04530 [Sphingobacteriales bacterium]